jgi:nitrogen fixation/metabolism regulation signal transduction histidine kinase
MGWAPRTLQGQLTTLFLVLILVPAFLLATLATRELFRAIDRWESPGVQNALQGSVELAVELMDRTRNDLRQRGQLLAAEPAMSHPPELIEAEAVRGRLATAHNLDFVQMYSTEGELLLEVTRDPQFVGELGELSGIPELAASDHPFLEQGDPDLLAHAGFAGTPGEREWILLVGIYLNQDFYQRRGQLEQGIAFYQTLPTLIRLRQRVILVTLAAGFLILALGSTWVARRLAARVSRPVQTLGSGMERVARGEDQVQVSPQGTEEMERLIRTFNTMSTELSLSRRELARAERLAAWRDVARRMAHEMRNALTPVTFSAHRIRKVAAGLEEADRERLFASLDTVLEEVEGLRRLADSFSELARLPVPEMTEVDLVDVVQKCAASYSSDKRRLQVEVPEKPVVVEGDRTLLRQALANVIKNAVEASGPGERIWVRLTVDENRARIAVEDEGPGWPEGDLEQPVEPYVTTKTSGTGLGLSIVQRTLLQHGGTLELGDRPEGGARVTLVLPFQVTGPGRGR